jgi:hypothetical protein
MPRAIAALGHAALWARKLSFGSNPVLATLPASYLDGGREEAAGGRRVGAGTMADVTRQLAMQP